MKLDAATLAQHETGAAQERQKRGAFIAERTMALMAELEIGPKLAHYLACQEWGDSHWAHRVWDLERSNARY